MPSAFEDFYELLGLNPSATFEDIRQAYRRLVRQFHPDVAGPEATEYFVRIARAYEVLSDPYRRRIYDRRLSRLRSRPRAQPVRATWLEIHFAGEVAAPAAGGDEAARVQFEATPSEVEVVVSPEMADQGGLVTVDVPIRFVCRACGGTGMAEPFVCPTCRGKGTWIEIRRIDIRIVPPVRDGQVLRIERRLAAALPVSLTVRLRLSWL